MHRPLPATPPDVRPATRAAIDAHPITFSGSGSEYFRVWIVNLLLMVVTLALYTPFARRRTAQYFFSHTAVAGTPLEFTASARRMFVGFLVFALLYGLIKLADYNKQHLLATALSLGAVLLAPFFWGSAVRFRLRATRWRGVRMAFVARWGEVYAASWPLLCMVCMWGAVILLAWWHAPNISVLEDAPPEARVALAAATLGPAWRQAIPAIALVMAALMLWCLAMLEFNYRRLQVRRTRIGQQEGHWPRVRVGAFVRIWFISALVALLSAIVVGLFSFGVMMLIIWLGRSHATIFSLVLLAIVFTVMLILLVLSPAMAYHEASVFRMMWNEIGLGQVARARCTLNVRGFVWLRVRNLLLTIVTLGFYRPFARAMEYRRKVESVTLHIKGGLEQLEGRLVQEQGALGDAIADGLGLDII